MVQNYKDLEVWKKSVALTTQIYAVTARFPVSERFGLTSQIRRASTSIAANIAEGWGRGSRGEYIQFLAIARGSLMELETHFPIARKLSYITEAQLEPISRSTAELGHMLAGVMSELKGRCDSRTPATIPET